MCGRRGWLTIVPIFQSQTSEPALSLLSVAPQLDPLPLVPLGSGSSGPGKAVCSLFFE